MQETYDRLWGIPLSKSSRGLLHSQFKINIAFNFYLSPVEIRRLSDGLTKLRSSNQDLMIQKERKL